MVYRATWEDEKIIVGTLGDIVDKVREAKITKTAIIIVGNVINPNSLTSFQKFMIHSLHMATGKQTSQNSIL